MFDISFSELLVIALVALVVIGPEKLPKVARTAGAFFGRLQRFVTQVKDEVNRESRFAELQRLQDEVKSSLQQGMDDVERSILPADQPSAHVIEHEPVTSDVPAVKKSRKPRQPRPSQSSAAQMTDAEQTSTLPLSSAEAQTQLFALPEAAPKKPRRARKAVVQQDGVDPTSEHTPPA